MFSSRKEEEEQGLSHSGKTFPLTLVGVTQHPLPSPGHVPAPGNQAQIHKYRSRTRALGTQPRTAVLLPTPSQVLIAGSPGTETQVQSHRAPCMLWGL